MQRVGLLLDRTTKNRVYKYTHSYTLSVRLMAAKNISKTFENPSTYSYEYDII